MEQVSKIFEELMEHIDTVMQKVVEIAPKENAIVATMFKMANKRGAEFAKVLANLAALLERSEYAEKKDKEIKNWMDEEMKNGTPINEMFEKFKIKCNSFFFF